MNPPLINVADPRSLSGSLTQILFIVEQINALSMHRLLDNTSRPQYLPHLLINTWKILERREDTWTGSYCPPWYAEITRRCMQLGIQVDRDDTLMAALFERLAEPAAIVADPENPRIRNAVGRDVDFQVLEFPRRLSSRFSLVDSTDGLSFSTVESQDVPKTGVHVQATATYWDEVLNPMSVMQDTLMHFCALQENEAEHYIQRWLQDQFRLSYEDMKLLLRYLALRINARCFGQDQLSMAETHFQRSETIGLRLLLSDILAALSPIADDELARRRAIGTYLFLRRCQTLRVRYMWFEGMDAGVGGTAGCGEPDAIAQLYEAAHRSQCVSALKPIDHNFLGTKMFGHISRVRGLNSVFRGGLLLGDGSGKTLVISGGPGTGKTITTLNLMCDIAHAGGLALYLTAEEGYEGILDRLVTFGLYDESSFRVVQLGDSPHEVLEQEKSRASRRGLLLLYAPKMRTEFSPQQVMMEVASAVGDGWERKAVAIDSVNSLELRRMDAESEPAPLDAHRLGIRDLIDTIQECKFFGILTHESDDTSFAVLDYLCDILVTLTKDDSQRSMEIIKSHNQKSQPGKHLFRIADRGGLRVYPSLGAIRSTLRRVAPSTFSEERWIQLPGALSARLGRMRIAQKSSTLVWGQSSVGNSLFMVNLITGASLRDPPRARKEEPPKNVLVTTFRTPEVRVNQFLRKYSEIGASWNAIRNRKLRWYSPGDRYAPEQLVSELWDAIRDSRRVGTPIDRIVFDETEFAATALPSLGTCSVFWPTVLELVRREALTAFFVVSSDNRREDLVRLFSENVDYIFHLDEGRSPTQIFTLEVEKAAPRSYDGDSAAFDARSPQMSTRFRFTTGGVIAAVPDASETGEQLSLGHSLPRGG